MAEQKPVILVDGSSYLFRAYHALPPLTNSHGEATGAVYGVVNMLKKLLADYGSLNTVVVFDAKGKTFRDDLYKEYKAHRPPMPDDLREQIEPLHEIVQAMGFPMLMIPGVEADDVIGTLAMEATRKGIEVVISTGDKDIAQLVNDHVRLINTMTNTELDRAGVIDKFGVPPERIIDFLALVGDSADNIPGVPKVGPKTAAKWLNEYGTLDDVIANAENIKGKVGENLRNNLDQLELSRQLTTIKCDVELSTPVEKLCMAEPDNDALRDWFTRLEFKTWLKQLSGDADEVPVEEDEVTPAKIEGDYETVTTQKQLDAWIAKLEKAALFSFDTETTSLDYMQAEIVGVSFAVEAGKAAYVPLAHDYPGAPDQLDRDAVLKQLQPLLEDEQPKKIGQNLKYDMSVLANHGIRLRGIAFDTMLESYVINSTGSRHDMDSLSANYLDHKTIKYEDVAGKGAKQLTFNQVPIETAAPYAAEDADITLRLHQALWPKLEKEPSLQAVFNDIEMPLMRVLSRIERNGVLVDARMLAIQSKQLAKRMLEIEEEAYVSAGQPFNLSSPKQIQEILFEKQGLPVISKTPKGVPSTAENVLQELAEDYELPRLILEYRSLSKLKSTYTDKLPHQINPATGRVHTSYHQAVAATGRLSSSDPNLQNIPIRSEEGRRIRKAFIAGDGKRIVAADYSQIELRIMAHLSGDKGLLDAFAKGEDIHKATAAEVFGVALDKVSSDQRRSAKAINFGLIYGMSAFGLARQLGIPRGDAQQYVELYFERYPGVKKYMDDTRAKAHDTGYVETLFGRRLYLPEINAKNQSRRAAAERTAINAPMQGTAADIIKLAMIKMAGWLDDHKLDALMIMQVHDELVFEVSEKDVDALTKAIKNQMESAASLSVPLEVDVGIGASWEEAH